MNILHVASEVAPFSKTGGLGDVVGSLPKALLHEEGGAQVQAAVVSARYGSIDPQANGLARRLRTLPVQVGGERFEVGVCEGRIPDGSRQVPVYLIEHPLFGERKGLYGPPDRPGEDYADNGLRFALLSRAALVLAQQFGLHPDVIHAHDWQAALALYYARAGLPREDGSLRPVGKVLTVHNLAFQGLLPLSEAGRLDIPEGHLTPEGVEFYGQVSLLKAGLMAADRVTTVSPRYAEEIQTAEFGCGLEGLLQHLAREGRLSGVLNGADYDRWSPWLDPYLPAPYGRPALGHNGTPGEAVDLALDQAFRESLHGKARCKAELQRELGLAQRPRAPLCATISRLTTQKGIELILEVLESEEGWQKGMQYVVLGSGDRALEDRLQRLARRHPGRMAVVIGYDEPLSHRTEAGADIYIMPSRFEPCGLNQMYSLRYGTIPVVRAVGGLDDSVVDFEARSASGTGFKFSTYSGEALAHAWHRAVTAYCGDEGAWRALQRRAMRVDLSWAASSRAYWKVYREAQGEQKTRL